MSQGRRSRNKGANGEREVAKILNQYGFNGERNARNGLSKEDVAHTINGVHIEVKRSEKILLPQWLRQAEEDCGEKHPMVVFRQSRQPWRAVVGFEWLLGVINEEPKKQP